MPSGQALSLVLSVLPGQGQGPSWRPFGVAVPGASQIAAFCKKPDQVLHLEKTLRDFKAKYLPILEQHLGTRVARLEITVFST